tara:strand:- start:3710 stop:4144 length:435 start_codon:yes stop_codon:yes gene_type:complete
MTEKKENNFKIILEYIKDLSIETPSATALLKIRENLSSYNMDIDISSLVLKNKSLEITTKLILQDKSDKEDKAFFEIKYATVISIDSSVVDKKIISKIVLCDLQKIIYPKIEKIFIDLIKNAGYPNIKFEKKVDFEKMYNDKFN